MRIQFICLCDEHLTIDIRPTSRQKHYLIGWVMHYLTGVAFACLLLAIAGTRWLAELAFHPALWLGLGTAVVPLALIQPCMGAGFAGSKTARPMHTRLITLANHGVFGIGLYVTGELLAIFD